jgi:hypothetical protein
MAGERRPGRPKGDGTNDDKELAAMADMILANPGLRPTTAYKRVVHRPTEAAIRRIQAKWRERRETLLAAAGDRRDRARERTAISPSAARAARFESATETAARRMDEMLGGFRSGLGRELAAMQALRDAVDPPALRELRRIMDNPLAKAMRSLDESTGVRAMREALGIWDNPTMHAAMGLEVGAVARALQAQDKAMRDLMGG